MDGLNLAFAFTAGVLATVNPCGWAMLPAFVAYYLGSRQEGYEEKPFFFRLYDGLLLGLLVTAGFLVIFSGAGIAISFGLRVIVQWMPFVALLVGVAMTLLGVWLLAGKSRPFSLPTLNIDLQSRNPKTALLFGIAYAFASLSCTLPVFLVVVGTSLTAVGTTGSAVMFFSYSAGMAVVLMAVSLSAALVKGAVTESLRSLLPYVHRIGAVMLILAGLYLIWYQGRSLLLFYFRL
jgi:cytochrome c-type biogenesis protein